MRHRAVHQEIAADLLRRYHTVDPLHEALHPRGIRHLRGIRHVPDQPASQGDLRMGLRELQLRLQPARQHPVVGVHPGDPLSAADGQTGVQGRGDAPAAPA